MLRALSAVVLMLSLLCHQASAASDDAAQRDFREGIEKLLREAPAAELNVKPTQVLSAEDRDKLQGWEEAAANMMDDHAATQVILLQLNKAHAGYCLNEMISRFVPYQPGMFAENPWIREFRVFNNGRLDQRAFNRRNQMRMVFIDLCLANIKNTLTEAGLR